MSKKANIDLARFSTWMRSQGYAEQTCREYPYFLHRYVVGFQRPINRRTIKSIEDVDTILADVDRALDEGGRGEGVFNIHDRNRNFRPALRLFAKFSYTTSGSTKNGESLARRAHSIGNDFSENDLPARVRREVSRIIRDNALTRELKKLYRYHCQICGEKLMIGKSQAYAEVHHLKPLGRNGNGTDKSSNMICVCPNHHALLDNYAFVIDVDTLKYKEHEMRPEFIDHHNARCRAKP